MFTSPFARRSSSSSRQFFAVVTAAFIALQLVLFVPLAAGQSRKKVGRVGPKARVTRSKRAKVRGSLKGSKLTVARSSISNTPQVKVFRVRDRRKDSQTANPTTSVTSTSDHSPHQSNVGSNDLIGTIKNGPTTDEVIVDQTPSLVNPEFSSHIELTPVKRHSLNFESTQQPSEIDNKKAHQSLTRTALASKESHFSLGGLQASGTFIISEYRLRGPTSLNFRGTRKEDVRRERATLGDTPIEDNDEFVEFYNNTDAAITVQTVDNSAGWALVASDGQTRVVIPNGTVIPARGHYLAANLEFSLTSYPGGHDGVEDTFSSPDIVFAQDIPDGSGIAIFNTADPANFDIAHRLDAVGYDDSPALYREGTGFQTASPGAEIGGNLEYSFLRDLRTGTPTDTEDNAADFISVNTSGQTTSIGTNLGAPGPENVFSPIRRLGVHVNRLDPAVGLDSPPNRVRDLTPVPNGANGTLSVRRKVINNTGAPVTRLRFRIKEITTLTSPPVAGQADLRALTSGDILVTLTDMSTVPVQGTVVEEPPFQPNGGGWNTSWSPTGIIGLASPLPAGAVVNVQFLLGVQATGSFRIFINVEALP